MNAEHIELKFDLKSGLHRLVCGALDELRLSYDPAAIIIEAPRDPDHGDFACNVALALAKRLGQKPRDLALQIADGVGSLSQRGDFSDVGPHLSRVEVAGPGFINFHIAPSAYHKVLPIILQQGRDYGRPAPGTFHGRVQVEFVSANPTGPLHVGHGRGAAYGAAVADLLAYVGFDVHREYYVNDAGRQMDILATSVWLR